MEGTYRGWPHFSPEGVGGWQILSLFSSWAVDKTGLDSSLKGSCSEKCSILLSLTFRNRPLNIKRHGWDHVCEGWCV